jgi:uncharacterized protein
MPGFNLFRKHKKEEEAPKTEPQAEPAVPAETQTQPETTVEPVVTQEEPKKEEAIVVAPVEVTETKVEPEVLPKIYLKAMPLRDLADLENVKKDVKEGNILILRISPLASKSIEDVKKAVNELFEFSSSIEGDIARLGEERVVVCPKNVRIWREKKPVPNATLTTAS